METVKKGLEITKEQWNSRKLSSYGYISGIVDILVIMLEFAGIGALSLYVIPNASTTGEVYFWYILSTLLFIWALQLLTKVSNPLNSYQTIIIRE
jgi:hypothetical protein